MGIFKVWRTQVVKSCIVFMKCDNDDDAIEAAKEEPADSDRWENHNGEVKYRVVRVI